MKSLLSPRLYKLYQYLKTGEKTGMQIQKHIHSTCCHTDCHDLRKKLKKANSNHTVSRAKYLGRTYTGSHIMGYKLERV